MSLESREHVISPNIHTNNDAVIVSSEKSETREDKGGTWYFCEREYGSFLRSFRLPPDANSEKAQAHTNDGVLEVPVPCQKVSPSRGKKTEVKKQ